MFILGHSVLGSHLARALRRDLPLVPLVVGTLLPDVIDKPLYYGLVLATGKHGANLGLISGTRTFGHTGALLLTVAVCGMLVRSRALAAVAAGMATHLLFDVIGDSIFRWQRPNAIDAVLYPLLGRGFPITPFHGVRDHFAALRNAYIIGAELAGAALLVRDWRRRRT